jgi:hypothetical protein
MADDGDKNVETLIIIAPYRFSHITPMETILKIWDPEAIRTADDALLRHSTPPIPRSPSGYIPLTIIIQRNPMDGVEI